MHLRKSWVTELDHNVNGILMDFGAFSSWVERVMQMMTSGTTSELPRAVSRHDRKCSTHVPITESVVYVLIECLLSHFRSCLINVDQVPITGSCKGISH